MGRGTETSTRPGFFTIAKNISKYKSYCQKKKKESHLKMKRKWIGPTRIRKTWTHVPTNSTDDSWKNPTESKTKRNKFSSSVPEELTRLIREDTWAAEEPNESNRNPSLIPKGVGSALNRPKTSCWTMQEPTKTHIFMPKNPCLDS